MADFTAWASIERRLQQTFALTARKLGLPWDRLVKYITSATEQEIMAGVVRIPDAHEHVFCFLRQIKGLPDSAEGVTFVDLGPDGRWDKGAAWRLTALKVRLAEMLPTDNVHRYQSRWGDGNITLDHIDQLCDDVYRRLSQVMLAEMDRLETADALDTEIWAHATFGRERTQGFVGRTDILARVALHS